LFLIPMAVGTKKRRDRRAEKRKGEAIPKLLRLKYALHESEKDSNSNKGPLPEADFMATKKGKNQSPPAGKVGALRKTTEGGSEMAPKAVKSLQALARDHNAKGVVDESKRKMMT